MTALQAYPQPARKALVFALLLLGTLCMMVFLPIFLCGGLMIKMDGANPMHLLGWMVGSGTVGGAALACGLRLALADPEY